MERSWPRIAMFASTIHSRSPETFSEGPLRSIRPRRLRVPDRSASLNRSEWERHPEKAVVFSILRGVVEQVCRSVEVKRRDKGTFYFTGRKVECPLFPFSIA